MDWVRRDPQDHLVPKLSSWARTSLTLPKIIQNLIQPGPEHFHKLTQVHIFPVLKDPRTKHSTQGEFSQSKAEGQNHITLPAGHDSWDVAQDVVGFLWRCTESYEDDCGT